MSTRRLLTLAAAAILAASGCAATPPTSTPSGAPTPSLASIGSSLPGGPSATGPIAGDLVGTISWSHNSTTTGSHSAEVSDEQLDLSVSFDEKDGQWVDAGSSFTLTGSSTLDSDLGDCSAVHKTSTTTGGEAFAGALASSIVVSVGRQTKQILLEIFAAGELRGHTETQGLESNGGPQNLCVTRPSDFSQGGGSTEFSQAEWGAGPQCPHTENHLRGTISDDGKTVAFTCSDTVTYHYSNDLTEIQTTTVSGQLVFKGRAP